MKVYIIGIGMGNPELLTGQAKRLIEECDCLIGGRRMLEAFGREGVLQYEELNADKIVAWLAGQPQIQKAAVLASGDVGFYSIARRFPISDQGIDFIRICGISSLQYFCARLGMPWDDVRVVSLHGRSQNLLEAVRTNQHTFVLTGGDQSASAICALLRENGLGESLVWVGENLSYPNERITKATAQKLAQKEFEPLAVMMVENLRAAQPPVTHGMPDEMFLRGEAPMTKSEVRTVSVAALRLQRGWTVWDVGAGTGSVSIEIARMLPGGRVYAVEKDERAIVSLKENRQRFNLSNLEIVEGIAPQILAKLPKPDAVFIGGSSGNMMRTFEMVMVKNQAARMVVNAITLETLSAALEAMKRFELRDQDVTQLCVARSRSVGGLHMMTGQNPIYIISGGGAPHDATT